MRAVLDDGVRVYRETEVAGHGWSRHRRRQIREWFDSDAVDWPFSFVNVCHALEMDPVAVRAEVQRAPQRSAA